MSSRRPRSRPRVADSADSLPLPRIGALFSRACRLRCPVCGGGPVLLSSFTVAPSCPACGLHSDRDEPGYWIGSYTVNLFVTEGVFAAAFVGGAVVTWPTVPWALLGVICTALTVVTPVAVFPFTKLLYL